MRGFGRFLFGAYVVMPVALVLLIGYDLPCWIYAKLRRT